MTILSFSFYLLVGISLVLYWLFPRQYRWVVLLLSNGVIAWLLNDRSYVALGLMYGMIIVAFAAGKLFDSLDEKKRLKKFVLIAFLLLEAGILLFSKDFVYYQNLLSISSISSRFVPPLGISYFTLSLIGYGLDCYWNKNLVEKNPFRFLLFGSYYPMLTSGPIVRYREVGNDLVSVHAFSYETVCFGLQRILWGMFKKLVLAERIGIIVNTIYGDPATYTGWFVWIAIFGFLLQLYADFTGSMDIIYGVSELYGIKLPENFDLPFMARNLSEFWRRWHITLGAWLKNYIFYPIIKTGAFQSFSQKTMGAFGKKWGRKIPVWCALFISWTIMGFWHGGTPKFLFVTLWFWFWIVIGEMLEPLFERVVNSLKIRTDCFSWHLFQSLRTFALVSLSAGIFRAESLRGGLSMYKGALISKQNPWILFDYDMWSSFGGLTIGDWFTVLLGLLILCAAAIIRLTTGRSVREWVLKQNLVFRWGLWFFLLFAVLIWGKYGPGYNTADFIYKGF
ncbi:MAG: MBOAT family protein [Lachnospiraceae bacterium]|nr:MBOAT family protein [Lachnospiraceae bacterium]